MFDYSDYRSFNLNEVAFPVEEYGFKITRKYWKGENRLKTFQLTAGIVDDMLTNDKSKLPIVDFTTMKKFTCVVADFDVLPHAFESFDQFYKYMYGIHLDACVTRSASGKVKIIFLVENMLHLDPLKTIKSLIADDLHEYLDTSYTALTQTYLTEALCRDLQAYLKTAIPRDPIGRSFVELQCEDLAKEYVHICSELETLLFNAGFNTKTFRSMLPEKRKQLAIQLLTSALELCNEGVMWNQEIFAQVLGLKSARTSAKILNTLQESGLIEMVANYSAGNKSRTYNATGALLELFQTHGMDTTDQVSIRNDTIQTNKINTLISKLQPPAHDANKYYVIIAKTLLKYGMNVAIVCKTLYDIDRRRPRVKQRPHQYFRYLANWGAHK